MTGPEAGIRGPRLTDSQRSEADLAAARDAGKRSQIRAAREYAGTLLRPLDDIMERDTADRARIFDHVAFGMTPLALRTLILDLTQAASRRSPDESW